MKLLSRWLVPFFLFFGVSNAVLAVSIADLTFADPDLKDCATSHSVTVEGLTSLYCPQLIDDLTGIAQLVELQTLNINTNPYSPDPNTVSDLTVDTCFVDPAICRQQFDQCRPHFAKRAPRTQHYQ